MHKTLRAKYQLKPNLFVDCALNIIEANDRVVKTYLKIKRQGDTLIPCGIKLFLDAEGLHKITARRTHSYDLFYITIQEVQWIEKQPLYICSPIIKETVPDRRASPRVEAHFSVQLEEASSQFIANNGTLQGLGLSYQSQRLITGLHLEESYQLSLPHKTQQRQVSAVVKHIHYDWKHHQHRIGFELQEVESRSAKLLSQLLNLPYISLEEEILPVKELIDSAGSRVTDDL